MNIEISRPTNFSHRVRLVSVKIADPGVISNRIGFEVPAIANWHFRPTEKKEFYMAPLPDSVSTLRGIIVNGEWECIVQLNVIKEEDIPMSIKDLKDILVHALEAAILPFQENILPPDV